jgi:hypothetical protein
VEARAGVYTGVEVNGPMTSPEGTSTKFADFQSASFWSLMLFLLAVLVLFIL